MKSTTKKIIIIILASLSILACLFKGGQSIINETINKDNSADSAEREQVYSIVKSFYGDAIDEEKLNQILDNNTKTNYKMYSVAIILDIILIILAARDVVKNRNSIIIFGIFSAFLTPTLIGMVMGVTILVASFMPSYDKKYEKQIAPKVEEVNTCKPLPYIIIFSIIYIFFYYGIFSMMFKWLNLNDVMIQYSVLINSLMFSAMFLLVVLMLRKEIIRDIKLFFKNFTTYLNISTPVFLIGFILQLIVGVCLLLITRTTPSNQANVVSMPLWFLIIFAILIGPAVEEGFFRGFIRKFVKNNVAFVIISSLLFSIMHVIPFAFIYPIQWTFVLQYLTIAVPISLVYVKTNNLAVSYFFHLCWNSISILLAAIALF